MHSWRRAVCSGPGGTWFERRFPRASFQRRVWTAGVVVLDALLVCAVVVVAAFLSCTLLSLKGVIPSSFLCLSLCVLTVGVVLMVVDWTAGAVLNETKRNHRG